MSCNHPLHAFKTGLLTENKKPEYIVVSCSDATMVSEFELAKKRISIDWSKVKSFSVNGVRYLTEYVSVPCGKCLGCRLDYRKEWRNRCVTESLYCKYTYFITLTYDDYHLPKFGVSRRDITLFLKRLRKNFNFRYFYSAEYGSKTFRPHYHIILFTDYQIPTETKLITNVFKSSLIEKSWPYGITELSFADESSISYVCGYTIKKINFNEWPKTMYKPFNGMSRMPALGSQYLIDNKDHILKYQKIYVKNGFMSVPQIYWRKLSEEPCYNDLKVSLTRKAQLTEQLLHYTAKQRSRTFIGSQMDFAKELNIKNKRMEKL